MISFFFFFFLEAKWEGFYLSPLRFPVSLGLPFKLSSSHEITNLLAILSHLFESSTQESMAAFYAVFNWLARILGKKKKKQGPGVCKRSVL